MPKTTAITPGQEQAIHALLPSLGSRNALLILLALKTGFRVSELLSLGLCDVVLPSGEPRPMVTVARGNLKGGRGQRRTSLQSRTVPATPSVIGAVRRHTSHRLEPGARLTDPLFEIRVHGRGLSRWQARNVLLDALRAIGVADDGRSRGMHSARKCFARSVYQASGHDLRLTQHALGPRYSTTTEAYLVINDDAMRAVLASLG